VIFRQLTSLGDWTFGRGTATYARTEKAIELNIRTRLLSWKGDCFFAQQDFVDWFSRLDRGQVANLNSELQTVILQSFGVVAINSFSAVLNNATRVVLINYNIATIYSSSFVNKLVLGAGAPIGS
jgi:hypothetical protein